MREYNRRVILLLFLLLNLSFVLQALEINDVSNYATAKNKKPAKKNDIIDPYPFSIYISLINGSIAPIRRPISNYFIEIPVTFGFGVGFEYRFTKWTALDGVFYGDFGFSWERKNYGDTGALCDYCFVKDYTLDLLQLNVYLQQLFSLKLYTNEFIIKWMTKDPKNKAKKVDKSVNAKVFFRIGATLEAQIFSKYYLFRNDELLSEGNFLDEVPDGPNPYGQTVDYRGLINPVIFGPHLGIGLKMYKGEVFSFQPEIRATFSGPPINYGLKEGIDIKGNDLIMIRNDGVNDENVCDYKITLEFAASFSFTLKFAQPKEKVIKIVLDFLNFYADSTKLLPESEFKLKLMSYRLRKYKNMKFRFIGHANSTGNKKNEYNLSVSRSKSIREYFIKLGVTSSSLSTFEGRGSNENIGSTITESGKRKNRRVEIYINE